ncbi:nucleoside triphosphate hydrolase [Rodentibacter caecimuris]|uniref:PhoH-like protein n=1 Tax=Rodentibacter caecimuris TaxID=1796644 RepID=A0A9X8YYH3_9PAST|nr:MULTISPECIES: PhoH family protein [Pasteurellaceae]AOF52265.1 Phosphate starvation-inducible protein PhoH, predicted ATPase [Pasteurellaceae bacterium NI1060]MCQ9122525.1 PhoH family protein [Rodentibacter heylii]MCR1836405.1 PhoH family protein [Pasteurella caecimuris]MCU0105844.1 PhoH family protein [Pasteurella caecimuris]OOF71663.1 nucleoside triphosphate hydrolase [Rodentibacter heylii]
MTTFTLEPQDNTRLQSLCGAFDDHLKLIETEFNLNISRNNFTFTIKSNEESPKPHHEKLVQSAAKLIQDLYLETAPIKGKVTELDLEDVHIALQESRMLSQADLNRTESKVYSTTIKTKRGMIKPRGENQIQYLHNILTHDISFGIGPAGTGKTFLAVAAAVEALERQEIRRVLLTRPAVEAGEKLGFLPGDLGQKIEPYLRPLYDALFEMLGFERVQKLMERNVIEIAPLAYMRGRTLNDSFIILDESQNTTVEQMKMFLTRIGFNSKAVITGDITQIDLPRSTKSGLRHAIEVLENVPELSFNYFDSKDIVRHPVVAKVVQAYEAWEIKDEARRKALAEQRKVEREKERSVFTENLAG